MMTDGMKCLRRDAGESGEHDETRVRISIERSDGDYLEHEGRAALIVVIGEEGVYATVSGPARAFDLARMDKEAGYAAMHAAFDMGIATEFMAARIALSGVLKEHGHEGD